MALGLPVEPSSLVQLAAPAARVLDHRSLEARWSSTADGYARDVRQADTQLRDELIAHGQPADPTTAATHLVSALRRHVRPGACWQSLRPGVPCWSRL